MLIIILCWIVIGVFNYGMTFGHFQNSFPTIASQRRRGDMAFGVFCGLIGPIMLLDFLIIKIINLCADNKYKPRLKNIKFW